MYHDMADKEIVVVDNFGDDILAKFCREKGGSIVRYERYTEIQGTAASRDRLFKIAKGEFVACIDSHVFLKPGFFNLDPVGDDLIHGPLVANSFDKIGREWLPVWRSGMWGIWNYIKTEDLDLEPYEIWGMGLGVFCTRRDSWLGFNYNFRGFGGEEGYIHEKYRKAGRRVMCYPNMQCLHYFCNQGRKIPYPVKILDKIQNYIIGFTELGLDLEPIKNHFGLLRFDAARLKCGIGS